MITNIKTQPDFVACTCEQIDGTLSGLLKQVAASLEQCIDAVTANERHTDAEFYKRVGPKGVTVLTELAFWRTVLQNKAPELVTEKIKLAGTTTKVNPDGTVTVAPKEPLKSTTKKTA